MKVKRTLEKTVQINFSRALNINQKLAVIWSVFIQEKWLSLSKFCEFCGISTISSPISFFPVLCYPWKNSSLAASERGSSISKNKPKNKQTKNKQTKNHYVRCLAAPLKSHIQGLFLIWPQNLLSEDSATPRAFCKNNQQQQLNISDSWGGETRWDKQEDSQNT